ncbi:thrombospondin type 3 repeat-containing protein, partial [Psychromonas ossibalaenae]|uniref:thrombospondin type 3 repeat-containing protein n=1 Tax=Psychromonas ossibalaenae TaxID=444922 RepID=UPI000524AD0A
MHYPKGPLIIRFAILISALLLHGCGGGGDSSETSKQPLPETVSPSTPDLSTGVLLDSAVSGIQYITTSGTTGITNSTGEYKYQDGDNITFSFAGITLPAVAAKKVLTPFDLVGSNNINDPSVINLIRLLQSLDDDGVFESKIILSSKKIVLLEKAKLNYKDLTMNIDEFEQLIISKKIFDDSQNTFVSSIAAVAHFKNTLDHSELIDTDQDGISNKSDLDDDNDGVEDTADLFQWDKNESSDFDFDYIGDNQDSDDDNDGIKDALDDQLKLLIKNITSVITDTVRNKAYITDKSAKRLYVVNLDNGLTEKQFQFTFMPER